MPVFQFHEQPIWILYVPDEEVESKGFKEKLQAIACKNERKRENVIRIGRIYIGKTACFIFVICLSVILTGGIVYAAVQNYIKSIKVNDS